MYSSMSDACTSGSFVHDMVVRVRWAVTLLYSLNVVSTQRSQSSRHHYTNGDNRRVDAINEVTHTHGYEVMNG